MTLQEKFGLKPQVIAAINKVFSNYTKIERVILYGSRAKGNYRSGSDIDLTLIAPTMGLEEILKIENDLDDLLLPYKIDLSLYHRLDNQELIDHIKRVGVEFTG